MHDFKKENEKPMFKNGLNQALHGDVIIEKIKSLPKNFEEMKKDKEPVLAYGEVTGHSHRLFFRHDDNMPLSGGVTLKTSEDGTKFLLVEKEIVLRHQEHDPRIIGPGIYKSTIQREYNPFANGAEKIRRVAD